MIPGFPCLGVLLQKLENPALRTFLKVPSNEVNLFGFYWCKLLYFCVSTELQNVAIAAQLSLFGCVHIVGYKYYLFCCSFILLCTLYEILSPTTANLLSLGLKEMLDISWRTCTFKSTSSEVNQKNLF